VAVCWLHIPAEIHPQTAGAGAGSDLQLTAPRSRLWGVPEKFRVPLFDFGESFTTGRQAIAAIAAKIAILPLLATGHRLGKTYQ
jgi:hypothetical protein